MKTMPLRIISVKLEEEDLEKLDRIASELTLNRSVLIRAAIKDYLRKLEKRRSVGKPMGRRTIKLILGGESNG